MKTINYRKNFLAAIAFLSLAVPSLTLISAANATTTGRSFEQNAAEEELVTVANNSSCRRVVTNGTPLNVRSRPGGRIIGKLRNGTRVTIVNRGANGWVRISRPMRGYVSSRYLTYCR
ncbi:SH3 domain-containing protein [Microseira sp. BLCC-F43]|jgi:uncharacterized protein YgiM (DUF1202 family)|uniref:SH3 domain-containing protein n=1 Tax=Microseira sp. BLCC-F43 TaxID=3153602 RepID=UPI0035BB538E